MPGLDFQHQQGVTMLMVKTPPNNFEEIDKKEAKKEKVEHKGKRSYSGLSLSRIIYRSNIFLSRTKYRRWPFKCTFKLIPLLCLEASLFRLSRARGREINCKFSACQIFESKQCGSRKYRTEFKGDYEEPIF